MAGVIQRFRRKAVMFENVKESAVPVVACLVSLKIDLRSLGITKEQL
jgi:3-polyprenyl-4-hydroxybenzoate decarboxylase